MDKNKLKIKYVLKIQKMLPSYPSREDILFEIYSYILKDGKVEFSDVTMNYIWQDLEGQPNWKNTDIEERFKELIRDNYIVEVKKTAEKMWYKLNDSKNNFI
jgi:hypothetical protein